jgi:hypothetical protein
MFKTNLIALTILLFISSCEFLYKESERKNLFIGHLKNSLSFEHEVEINENYFSKGLVDRPVGTWVRLVETEGRCVDYKIPSRVSEGELVISSKELKCDEMPVQNKIASLKNVSKLDLKFTTNIIKGKKIRNGNFGYSFSFKYLNEDVVVKVLAFNLIRSDYFDKVKFEKYDSHSTYRWQKGLRVHKEDRSRLRSAPWKGSTKNDFLHGKINFCYRVDNQCNVTLENHCNDCLNGWVDVVDVNCNNSGGSKVCAPLKCGKRGMPACPRGSFWKGIQMTDLCFNDSDAGYCEKGLKTICDENKILTCI